MPRKTAELQGRENLLLKGSHADWTPKPVQNTRLKSTQTIDEGDTLTILKCVPKRQEPCGSLPREWVIGGSHLRTLRLLVNTGTNRSHFGILHLNYCASGGTQLRVLPISTLWQLLLDPTAGLGQPHPPVLHDSCSSSSPMWHMKPT